MKHTFKIPMVLFLSAFFPFTAIFCQVEVIPNIELESKRLQQPVNLTCILPQNYNSTSNRYPVVYLLHGFGGDNVSWLSRCKIDQLIDSLQAENTLDDFIYVMPNAGNSYYVNNYDSSFQYSNFFLTELVPFIDERFRTIPQREYRALLGLSMGGFGSIILATEAPDLFGNVVAMSAAVRNEEQVKSLPQKRYNQLYAKVFGPDLSSEERITNHWKSNSPYYLIDTTTAYLYRDINWYIDCGWDDFLRPANEAFHDLLSEYQIPHQYHIRPGRHNWAFWYSSTVHGLLFLDAIFDAEESVDIVQP